MIGRRDKEPLEPAELGNVPGMHPELIQQVQRATLTNTNSGTPSTAIGR
jgi:hypothetical protein